jgi:hypothetical protein
VSPTVQAGLKLAAEWGLLGSVCGHLAVTVAFADMIRISGVNRADVVIMRMVEVRPKTLTIGRILIKRPCDSCLILRARGWRYAESEANK